MKTKLAQIPIWLLLCLFGVSHSTERISSPALPDIAAGLNISTDLVQLSSSLYFSGLALGIFAMGRLSDFFGRRPVLFYGIGIYAISSILCSISTNIYIFLIGRFFQAFGISVGSVLSQAMARDSYEGSKLANVYATVAISLSFIPSVSLVLGGYIVQYISWQANFGFIAILGVILLILCIYYLPETNCYIGKSKLSYFNILCTMISDKKVLLYACIVGCVNGITIGFFIEAPFIFINHLGFQPSQYGLVGIWIACANLMGGILNRTLIKKLFPSSSIMQYGMILSFICCMIMFLGALLVDYNTNKYIIYMLILIPTMGHSIGHNLIVPHILHLALVDYKHFSGSAGAIFGASYYFLVAFINYIIASIHESGMIAFATLFLALSMMNIIIFSFIKLMTLKERNY